MVSLGPFPLNWNEFNRSLKTAASVGAHPVTPLGLGAIERRVGARDELTAVPGVRRIGGDPTAHRQTSIRDALLAGEVGFAATLLGRPYNLSGRVVFGNRRGGGLGFPTANIAPDKELVPARGVYAVRCLHEGERHDGVLNIGFNPTFADGKLSIEAHIFDFQRNIYGGILDVHFIERIRDEVRFTSPEQLIAQIDRDVARVREILKSPG